MHDAVKEINAIPLHKGWNHNQITTAIKKISTALGTTGAQPALAFRNLDELSDSDLLTVTGARIYSSSKRYYNGSGLTIK